MLQVERAVLTGDVNGAGDEAVSSELPGLSHIYNYRFPPNQELLQLLITHDCARWRWTECAEQQLCV